MKKAEQKLTLDGPTSYQIKVPGELDARCSDWAAGMTLSVESVADGLLVTTLTGTVDQAALAERTTPDLLPGLALDFSHSCGGVYQ